MGNSISQLHQTWSVPQVELTHEDQQDAFFLDAGATPPGFSDLTYRLTELGLPPSNGTRFVVRDDSLMMHLLRDALCVLGEAAHSEEPAADHTLPDCAKALLLLARADVLTQTIFGKPIDTENRLAITVRQAPPEWLDKILLKLGRRIENDPNSGLSLPAQAPAADPQPIDVSHHIPSIHWAALTGEPEALLALIHQGADIMETDSRGRTPLHAAVTGGKIDNLRLLLERGADYEALDLLGRTPLLSAVQHERVKAIGLLIKYGANPDGRVLGGMTPLGFAASEGKLQSMDRLLAAGACIDGPDEIALGTPLHLAATCKQEKSIEFLLKRGANPQRTVDAQFLHALSPEDAPTSLQLRVSALQLSVLHGLQRAVGQFKKHGVDLRAAQPDGSRLLNIAASAGNMNMLNFLIQEGADVCGADHKGLTPLHWAATHAGPDMIRRLIKLGARTDARDQLGNTPLHLATTNRSVHSGSAWTDLIKTLMGDNMALINARNHEQRTPLHLAATMSDGNAARALLKEQPNLEAREQSGLTALSVAAAYGNLEAATLLLEHRANVSATDNSQSTALHHAVLNGEAAIAKLLIEKGADPKARNKFRAQPIHASVESDNAEVVRVLLEAGSSAQAAGPRGRNLLDLARAFKKTNILQLIDNEASSRSSS